MHVSAPTGLLPVPVARGQLYLGGKAAANSDLLHSVGATHFLALTQEPPQPPEGAVVVLHCATGGGSSHADALARLCTACDVLDGVLEPAALWSAAAPPDDAHLAAARIREMLRERAAEQDLHFDES